MYRDFGLCKSRSVCTSLFCRLRSFIQGIAEHNLKTAEKQVFFIAPRTLAEIHGRLPESTMITENIEVSDKILANGGFADVRTGTYMGHLVAVKTMKVSEQDDFQKLRKVSVDDIFCYLVCVSDCPRLAILQRSCPLEHPIPSERLETRWGSGGHVERSIHHRFRVDGARKHHAIH